MNIGYLIKFNWYPPKGGAASHAYQVALNLITQGHQLHTIYYHHPNPMAKVYRQRELFQFLNAIDVLYIRADGDFGYEIFTYLKFLKLFRLPIVWEINSPLEELLMRGKTEQHVKKLHRKRAFLAKFVDAAICVSQANADYAQNDLGISRVYVVPNGSDIELFSPFKKDVAVYANIPQSFKLIWSGSAEYKWHGLDLIREISSKTFELDKDIAFILIGNKTEISAKRHWGPNVHILERVDYLEIPRYIASADAGLCLYDEKNLSGKFYFSPLKLFDYMASGLPVIATRVGQIMEVIKKPEEGILVDNDADEIVKQVLYLKGHPKELKRMGTEARLRAEEFYNWGRVGEQTEKILRDVIGKN